MPRHTPNREEQALLEVGVTDVSRPAKWLAASLFVLTISLVAVIQPLAERAGGETVGGPFRELLAAAGSFPGNLRREGLLAANRELLAAMDRFEEDLDESSILRRRLLPPTQAVLTRLTGLGNEQAYVGRDGWLFYRADVDHVTAPGFLEPDVLLARSRSGNAWDAAPQPDPRPALVRLAEDLEARGVRLLLLPTPVKPAIEPGRFSARAEGADLPLRNPSEPRLLEELAAAGIEVLDAAEPLARLRAESGEALYLETDTHWTPAAMDEVARRLAERLRTMVDLSPPGEVAWVRREAGVEGRGDVAVMLDLPADQELVPSQTVTVQTVSTWEGLPWSPDPQAEILILGDSFTNVFSEPALGWGSAAGLAEQLTFHLGRPVDRIAQNAGGAHTTREALRRALESDPGRLDSTRVVVYQFAARELSAGDWRSVELPAAGDRLSSAARERDETEHAP